MVRVQGSGSGFRVRVGVMVRVRVQSSGSGLGIRVRVQGSGSRIGLRVRFPGKGDVRPNVIDVHVSPVGAGPIHDANLSGASTPHRQVQRPFHTLHRFQTTARGTIRRTKRDKGIKIRGKGITG